MVQPQRAWDFTLASGGTTLNIMVARGENNEPLFSVTSAPTLQDQVDTREEVTYSSVPPSQGKTQAIVDVSKGAGHRDWKPGGYAFAESIETEDGIIRPGPLLAQTTLSGGGALDGTIVANTLHSDGITYIAAGRKVYRWNSTNQNWEEPSAQPDATATLTDLLSFSAKLYAFFGATRNMRYSADNGATWADVPGFTAAGDSKARTGCIREQRTTRPRLLVVVDPDLSFEAEDPVTLTSWDTGSRIGQESTAIDGFTSVTVAPDGALLFGKKMGWRTMDAFGNVDPLFAATWLSTGQGKANFYRPVVGPRRNLYTIVHDYDIIEYDNGRPSPGFGPARFGKGVSEMEKALVGLAGDGQDRIYVALAGSEGYVMKGTYLDADGSDRGQWRYHGAYCKVGVALTYLWMATDPNDNQLYLWMAPSATPFRPYRALIPRENLDIDTNARFVSSANIRFGYHDNGFAHDTKVGLQAMPVTRNLLPGTRSVELQFRTDDATSFTSIGSYTDSPEPSNTVDTYYPAGTTGKKIELKAIITNSSSTGQAIIDRIVARHLTRHLRTNIITATILANRGQLTRMGARSDVSGSGLRDALDDMMKASVPPLLTDDDARTWTVDIQDIDEVKLKKGDYAFKVTMLEIPTIQSIASSVAGVSHSHKTDSFTGDGIAATVTLTSQPIGPVFVTKNDTYMVEGVTEDFTRSGTTITFAVVPASGADIRVHYPY